MAITKTIDGRTYREIIVRFRNQEDLDKFNDKLGLKPNTLTTFTKEIFLPDLTVKYKKPSKKRGRSGTWKENWVGMPYYINEENEAYAKIDIYFDEDHYDLEKIEELMEQEAPKAKSLWFPKWIIGKERGLRVVGGNSDLKYPVYVISKGRAQMCKTSYFLSLCEVNHYVAVEPQEYEEYMSTVGKSPYTTVIVMDMRFKDEYETYYEEQPGEERKTGPGAVRNFVWWHSMNVLGAKKHTVCDDNIQGLQLLTENKRLKVRTGAFLRAFEDFTDAHTNVKISSLNYRMFAAPNSYQPAYIYNTRMYSWQLIDNSLWDEGIKWRAKYNEDTIISLDVMERGYATLQTNFFLQNKLGTQTLKGGNTDEFYAEEGTYNKSKMLVDLYPEVAELKWRFGRIHHYVDYSKYADIDPGFDPSLLPVSEGINDYGMYIVNIDDEDEYTYYDTKSGIEEKYHDKVVYRFDGTRYTELGKEFFEK